MKKNTKHKGDIAETAVIHHLAKLNLPVFKELGDNTPVDIITLVNKKPVTIQVKWGALSRNNSINLTLRKNGPCNYTYHYQTEDFDLFAMYAADVDKIIWVNSREALVNRISMAFRLTRAKNNQQDLTRYMEDYTDFYKALNYAPITQMARVGLS